MIRTYQYRLNLNDTQQIALDHILYAAHWLYNRALDHRRQGCATEAIGLVLRYYFGERRYQKVNAEVYSFNNASMALHERLGFALEGGLRRMVYTGGVFHDALMYDLTQEEFVAATWNPDRQK